MNEKHASQIHLFINNRLLDRDLIFKRRWTKFTRIIILPAFAGRKPSNLFNASLIAVTTAALPCNWNSQQSSPVKLFGAGNHKTMPLSIKSLVRGCHNFRNVAYLGRIPWFVGLLFVSKSSAIFVFGPDTRITATPHLPYPFWKFR